MIETINSQEEDNDITPYQSLHTLSKESNVSNSQVVLALTDSCSKEIQKEEPKPIQFYIISISYLIFTITDSALRMIVLFELYKRKFNIISISIMFSFYEAVGIFTNLFGGIMGTTHGLKQSLLVGLVCQILGITLLYFLVFSDKWDKTLVIVFVTLVQSFSGIAKDMVKLAGKSSTKLIKVFNSGHKDDNIFKLVAWLTGAKNSVKGLGFFIGGMLISYAGYVISLTILLLMILFLLPISFYLNNDLGKSKAKSPKTLSEIFKRDEKINTLSIARFLLFGSRDVWFEVALPIYLRQVYGWDYIFAGMVMAIWIIFYGFIQSSTPFILKNLKMFPVKHGNSLIPWTILLFLISFLLGLFLQLYNTYDELQTALFLAGIYLFGLIFAVNSSIHSYLVVAYSPNDKVAMTVGFYYMANACGRLFGTLASGILYYNYGLAACIWASVGLIFLCMFANMKLQKIE